MACSKKTVVFLAVVALMALVAAAVPAGSRSFPLEAGEHCSESKNCNPDNCGATCAVLGINGVGVCKDDAGVPSCCCVPKPSASVGVQIV
ncbi:hypothetical protein HU200_016643 [Digitaria exilis]|uniref:Uncharacterized protein n=1 Tax=Digitaria exilis TaxID=1010633 RepID=A0A835KJH9_9POAL|nr:hypothetical protein HU200_016643 [Digitaria exilis]CAB3491282.1 unnamed protein product [Digitaria exilis]